MDGQFNAILSHGSGLAELASQFVIIDLRSARKHKAYFDRTCSMT